MVILPAIGFVDCSSVLWTIGTGLVVIGFGLRILGAVGHPGESRAGADIPETGRHP